MKTDFWWLQEERYRSLFVGVGHHRPLMDHDDPNQVPWFHSVCDNNLSPVNRLHPLDYIHTWRKVCDDVNVYRSLTIYDGGGDPILLGPFLIDIDNSRHTNGYEEDLDDALKVARQTAMYLADNCQSLDEKDMRIFFSGRKGFNIEINPAAIGIRAADNVCDQLKLSAAKQDGIRSAIRDANRVPDDMFTSRSATSNGGTTIDLVYRNGLNHPYIRLHDSINKWTSSSRGSLARRRIAVRLDDLFNLSVEQICRQAERCV